MGSKTESEVSDFGQRQRRWTSLISTTIWGLFGLALARAVLDTWPFLTGPLPRGPLALVSALALAAAGYRLSLSLTPREAPRSESGVGIPPHSLIPLLLPATTLFTRTTHPLRDWILVLGAVSGIIAIIITHYALSRSIPLLRLKFDVSHLYPISLALFTTLLYLKTLAPTVGEADTFEFQVNVVKLGISHGSGYPLYILLAKLFSLLPLGGTVAWRINLSAAFFGVTASLVCYALACALHASRPASWIAALSLAASIGLWSRAVEAEVYTLHVTLVGLLLLLAFRGMGEGEWRLETRDWAFGIWGFGILKFNIWHLAFFLFGLSLSNHLTTALLAPALLISLISRISPTLRSPHIFLASLISLIILFALGLSVYLYLPVRWPAVNNGEMMTWEMFLRFFTGAEAHGALRLDAWYTDLSRYAVVGRKALDQFGWPGAITALLGLAGLFRNQRAAALVTLTAWAAFAFFGLSFYVPDPDYSSFLLPAHLVQAVWIGCGISRIVYHVSRISIDNTRYAIRDTLYSLFFLLPASLIWINLPKVDQSNDWREYRLGQYILSQPLIEGAAILADSELIAPLYYLQVAEGVRPDLDIIVLPAEEYYRAELDARVSNGQTVYLGRYLPHLTDVYYLYSIGPLTEAKLEPSPLPDGITPPGQNFIDSIRLRGFKLDSASAPTDYALRITLYWQAIEPPPANYLVTLRLIDFTGMPVLAGPAEVPVGQMYPTAAWPTNDVVADFHNFALDPALEPGRYFLQVGLFPPFSAEGLKLESGGSWLTLADVTLTEPTTEPIIPHPARIRFNGAWLLGYDAPETVAPGSQMTVTLYWQSDHSEAALLCAGENCVPVNARAGDGVTVQRVTLPIPNQVGDLRLRVGVPADFVECGWWPALPGEYCDFASISVEGVALAPDAINFDQKIVLDSLEIETPQAAPGQTVIVSAEWRGLTPMSEDYTAFVHLLGPDGIVHGQVDMWPVQGTLPTSQWPINQPISDRFEVRVPDDAPPGEYTVEVGWYLLATLDRLPVVTHEGVAVDDKYVIAGLVIGN